MSKLGTYKIIVTVISENSLLVHSRYILPDVIYVLLCLLIVYCYLKSHFTSVFKIKWFMWKIFFGVCTGLAIG